AAVRATTMPAASKMSVSARRSGMRPVCRGGGGKSRCCGEAIRVAPAPTSARVQPETCLTLYSFLGLFWGRFMAGRPARHKAAKFFGDAIDDAELDVGEADDPVAGFGLGDTDGFVNERFAEEEQVAAPSDLAIAAHAADGVLGIVPGVFDLGGIGPGRAAIAAGRWHLAERLVRTVVVEVVAEAIEACLLLGGRVGGRPRGLGLEGAVHALMPAVLLRLARVDALETDAELDPVHGKPRQAAGTGARGEGRAVVAADGTRQAELAKGLVDDRLHRLDGLRDDAALDEEAAVGIGDGERIAALTVGGAKPALEIDAPEVVRLPHRQERLRLRHCRPTAPPRRAQSFATQQVADRRRRRPKPLRIAARQYRAQLLRSPMRPFAPQRHDRRGGLLGHRQAMALRRARAWRQAAHAFLTIPLHQPVAGVAADATALTQRRHRQFPLQVLGHEGNLLVRHTGFLPRHRQRPPFADEENLSGIYPVYPVRHVSGSDRLAPPHPNPLRPAGAEREGPAPATGRRSTVDSSLRIDESIALRRPSLLRHWVRRSPVAAATQRGAKTMGHPTFRLSESAAAHRLGCLALGAVD